MWFLEQLPPSCNEAENEVTRQGDGDNLHEIIILLSPVRLKTFLPLDFVSGEITQGIITRFVICSQRCPGHDSPVLLPSFEVSSLDSALCTEAPAWPRGSQACASYSWDLPSRLNALLPWHPPPQTFYANACSPESLAWHYKTQNSSPGWLPNWLCYTLLQAHWSFIHISHFLSLDMWLALCEKRRTQRWAWGCPSPQGAQALVRAQRSKWQ